MGARRRHRHAEASAALGVAGARMVHGVSARRLGLLPVRDGAHDLCAMGRVARVGALPRRREAHRRFAAAHVHSVLQFPCAQVQRQHGADPALGARHVVLPALVRDAQRHLGRARGRRRSGRDAGEILVGVPARGPRCCGARRSAPRRLFPLGRAMDDDCGGRNPAGAACRVDRGERFRAAHLCGGVAPGDAGQRGEVGAWFPARRRGLYRGAGADLGAGDSAELRRDRGHAVAAHGGASLRADRVPRAASPAGAWSHPVQGPDRLALGDVAR